MLSEATRQIQPITSNQLHHIMDKKRSRNKHDKEDTNQQSILCLEDIETQLDIHRTMIREGANDTDLKDIRKAVSRSIRKDKWQYQAKIVNKNLDVRDQYMGLKNLRRNTPPSRLA